MFPSSHFDDQQKRVVFQNSKEYKELEKARQAASKRAYWSDLEDQQDRMTDGSDEQGWDVDDNSKGDEDV